MARGLYRYSDGWVQLESNIPIPGEHYDLRGYQPSRDKLPTKEEYEARETLVAAEHDGRALAKQMDDPRLVELLMDLGAAWRQERQTGEVLEALKTAPQDARAIFERYRDARIRLDATDYGP